MLAAVADWRPDLSLDDLSPEVLSQVAFDRGLDFATTVLYDRLLSGLSTGNEIVRIETLDDVEPDSRDLPSLIAVVPGAFYLESPHTGADGQTIGAEARRLGIRSEIIPVRSFGGLAENSRIISRWLAARREESIVLVSLSKGGAEVKNALVQPHAESEFKNVIAWINLSGILEQSPLARWLLRQRLRCCLIRLWFWWRGYEFRVVYDYATQPISPWSFPPHLKPIHVVGFPLRRHLSSPLARRGHRRLASLGPNDSAGNVLAEVVRRPGTIVPIWGADHYLRPGGPESAQLVRKLLALACRRQIASESNASVAGAPS